MKIETVLPTTDTEKFYAGYFAAQEGARQCDNPDTAGTPESKAWDNGWLFSRNLDEFRDPVEGSLRAQDSAVEWRH